MPAPRRRPRRRAWARRWRWSASTARQIGAMSCNPAIGGLGKGHLVREVDAFDGLIARAADEAAHPLPDAQRQQGRGGARPARPGRPQALQGGDPRADRRRRRAGDRRGRGERASCSRAAASPASRSPTAARCRREAVILATGTFLGGKLHFGMTSRAGGRVGERAATALAHQLRALGLPLARLKTGTPPRLDGRTIDWAGARAAGIGRRRLDDVADERGPRRARSSSARSPAPTRAPTPSSAPISTARRSSPARSAASGRATARRSRTRSTASPTATATRSSSSPRGWTIATVYPNGISTSLPEDVQLAMVRSMAGLERAEILQPGYAVEYDHVDPRILEPTLARARRRGPLSRRPDQRHHRL